MAGLIPNPRASVTWEAIIGGVAGAFFGFFGVLAGVGTAIFGKFLTGKTARDNEPANISLAETAGAAVLGAGFECARSGTSVQSIGMGAVEGAGTYLIGKTLTGNGRPVPRTPAVDAAPDDAAPRPAGHRA